MLALPNPDHYAYPIHHAACDHVYPVQFLNNSPYDLILPIDRIWTEDEA